MTCILWINCYLVSDGKFSVTKNDQIVTRMRGEKKQTMLAVRLTGAAGKQEVA